MTTVILGIIVLAVLAFAAWREHENRAERERLEQRIMAPEREIIRYAREQAPAAREERKPPRVLVSDDEAQVQAIREREGVGSGETD